jgi:FKBP-type peptidyl-prolyl cis-trans isomerase 2
VSVLELLGRSAVAEARRGLRAGEQLRAQLIALAGGRGAVRVHQENAWQSATFNGTRHTLQLRFQGDEVAGGEALIAAAPCHEFVIPGQLVAEVAVVDVDHRLAGALLTVTIKAWLLEDD